MRTPTVTVLVVEDFEPYRRFIHSALREWGPVNVIEASDGLEAVQKGEESRPDLILLDIGLPKLNGFEAAKRLRTVAPQAKLLFVSQEFSSDVIEEALRLGAQGYVHKARAQSDLLPAVEAVLQGQQFVTGGWALREGGAPQAFPSAQNLFRV